jgi:hypothetical protein
MRLFYQLEHADRALRAERISALRAREQRLERVVALVSVLLPGAAGWLARRSLRALIGALLFSVALMSIVGRHGVVPDPLVAGAAGPFAFLTVAAIASIGYALVVATSLAARRRS